MSVNVSGVKAKTVVNYVVMPGIVPRIRDLTSSGFGYIGHLIAQVYAMVGLIPAGHPYLNTKNIGDFSIRQVIAVAANNLVFSRRHADQIIIFGLTLFAIVLFLLQIVILIFSFVVGGPEASAATWPYPEGPSIFVTGAPADDIAFMLLDRVFGIPGFFGSCVSTGTICMGATSASGAFPWPFHAALQELFRFYSMAMLIIATIVLLYYIVVVVVETATTGTPFGQRFQNVWVPIRLVVALGLLVPINYGYSAGQYIVFGAAKYGSSIATNGWIRYNNAINDHSDFASASGPNPLGEQRTFLSLPSAPDITSLVEAMSYVHTCAFLNYMFHQDIAKFDTSSPNYLALPEDAADITNHMSFSSEKVVKAYLVKSPESWMTNTDEGLLVDANVSYQDALEFYEYGDIVIRFGTMEEGASGPAADTINKRCGEIRIPISDARDASDNTGLYNDVPFLGTVAVQHYYFNLVRDMWADSNLSEDFIDFAGRFTLLQDQNDMYGEYDACSMGCAGNFGAHPWLPSGGCGSSQPGVDCNTQQIGVLWRQEMINEYQTILNADLLSIWAEYSKQFSMDAELMRRGWGGAGIWFNQISNINGAWISSILGTPTLVEFPEVMEAVKTIRQKNTKDLNVLDMYNPRGDGKVSKDVTSMLLNLGIQEPVSTATTLHSLFMYWNKDQKSQASEGSVISSSEVENFINGLFGTFGLVSMSKENAQTHPLSQLTALGKGIVDASIRNIGISMGLSTLGAAIENPGASQFTSNIAGVFNSIAYLGLSAGIVLYYVVPLLPFIYFFFAVASWVKTIFEAMVGVPLWALAHLRLDGDGLPGDSASGGYFLIFEIFLRPILTVFGLLAAMLIFTAQVRILNLIWTLVLENLGGFTQDSYGVGAGDLDYKSPVVDQFFYTVLYAIVVYMMATAAFKLIDKIPDNILRWAGEGVSSFGDINQDSVDQLARYASMGGMTMGREAATGVQQLGAGVGGGLGQQLTRLGRGFGIKGGGGGT
ncbi:MAG: hypothetical protein CMH26_04590 [Micavibrio sp.]|nr:hypothetical protein [Micavibrio sp.]